MNDQLRDDEFDRRLREATRRLAGGPASAGLRARIAAVPREQPGPASGRRRFGLGARFVGAMAALIVLAIAAILLASTLPHNNAVVPGASSTTQASPTTAVTCRLAQADCQPALDAAEAAVRWQVPAAAMPPQAALLVKDSACRTIPDAPPTVDLCSAPSLPGGPPGTVNRMVGIAVLTFRGGYGRAFTVITGSVAGSGPIMMRGWAYAIVPASNPPASITPPSSPGLSSAASPATGRLVSRTPLPSTPLGPLWITVADGAPWIALGGDPQGTVERIDPTSGKVTETVKVGFAPSYLAAYGTSLWVTNGTGAMTHPPGPYVNTVQRIDTRTGRILVTVPLLLPGSLVADASGAWVVSAQHSLVHVSLTGRVLGSVALASGSPSEDLPVSLAIAGGRIWVVLAHGGASGITLEAIDPADLKIVLMTDVTQEIGWLVPTPNVLYGAQVTGTTTFAWTRIDLQTGRVTVLGNLPVHPAQFEGLAVTADGAWVLDPGAPPAQTPRVIPFDPMTGRQTGAGVQLPGSFGDLMVASGRDVWTLGNEVDHFRF